MIPVPRWVRSGKIPKGVLNSGQRVLLRVLCEEADETGWVGRSAPYLAEETGQSRGNFYKQIKQLTAKGILHSEARKIQGRTFKGWRLTLAGVTLAPREDTVDLAEYRALRQQVRELEAIVDELRRERELRVLPSPAEPVRATRRPAAPELEAQAFIERLESSTVTCVQVGDHTVFAPVEDLEPFVARGHEIEHVPLWAGAPLGPAGVVTLAENGVLQRESPEALFRDLWWYRAALHDDPGQRSWFTPYLFRELRDDGRPGPFGFMRQKAREAEARHQARADALLGRERRNLSRGPVALVTADRSRNLSRETVSSPTGPPPDLPIKTAPSADQQDEALDMLARELRLGPSSLSRRTAPSDASDLSRGTVSSPQEPRSELSKETVPSAGPAAEIPTPNPASGR